MKTDDFEKRLQRQPQREIPGAWREEVLAKAWESAGSAQTAHTPHPGFFHFLQALFSRPQRIGWAGLTAAWIVIVTLHLATGETSQTASITTSAAPTTPETLQALKQQRLLLAELVDRHDRHEADRLKAIAPGPRSQRREESATA